MRAELRSWEKAELHLHLEGSVDARTLREICPQLAEEEIAAHYRHGSFLEFLQNYVWVVKKLETPEHYALALRRLVARLREENVSYVELNLSVGVILWRMQNFEAIFAALSQEREKAGIEIYWIFDAVRQFGPDPARRVLELAAAKQQLGVVGFGLGGDEERGPASLFKEICAEAAKRGLHIALHAGETGGPKSIWEALEAGSERIGHGIAAVEDPVLMEHLRRNRIPLEVCISSNVATRVVHSVRDHPLRKLYEAGIPLTLNTDDPAMFNATLTGEYDLARGELAFTVEELSGIRDNAFCYAFAGPRIRPRNGS